MLKLWLLGCGILMEICVHIYIEQVRAEVEKQTNKNFSQFTPMVYSTQVVAGTNYFIKVRGVTLVSC